MTGSYLAPILIPIGAAIPLAFWIVMVFYADSHPSHGEGASRLDSGEYDTGLQGNYLTKPELRVPPQERRRLDEAAAAAGSAGAKAAGGVPGQRQAERQREPAQQQAERR